MSCPYSSGNTGSGGAFLPPYPVVTAAGAVAQLVAVGVTGEPKPLGALKPVVAAEPNVAVPVVNPVFDVVVLPYAFPPNPSPTKLG